MEPVNQPVQSAQPAPPNIPPVQKNDRPPQVPPKKSGFLVSLLSILLLLAVGAAGFFAWQTQNLVKQLTESQTQPTTTPSPQPTTNPTSDWETYQTDIYKISFPSDIIIKEDNKKVVLSKWGDTQKENAGLSDGIFIDIYTETSNLTLEQLVDESISFYNKRDETSVMEGKKSVDLHGKPAMTYTIGSISKTHYTVVQNPNNLVEFVTFGDTSEDPTEQGFSSVVDQILSTFEFLD